MSVFSEHITIDVSPFDERRNYMSMHATHWNHRYMLLQLTCVHSLDRDIMWQHVQCHTITTERIALRDEIRHSLHSHHNHRRRKHIVILPSALSKLSKQLKHSMNTSFHKVSWSWYRCCPSHIALMLIRAYQSSPRQKQSRHNTNRTNTPLVWYFNQHSPISSERSIYALL
jgi:hypothetical protein